MALHFIGTRAMPVLFGVGALHLTYMNYVYPMSEEELAALNEQRQRHRPKMRLPTGVMIARKPPEPGQESSAAEGADGVAPAYALQQQAGGDQLIEEDDANA